MWKLKYYSSLWMMLLLGVSCGKGNGVIPEPPDQISQRTVLMYMGADVSDLTIDSYGKLKAVLEGWNDEINGNFIIYQDAVSSKGPRLIRITGEGDAGYDEKYYGAQMNSADPEVFKAVIREVTEQFPAESYGLIVFSHGSGWLPEHTVATSRSIITDGTEEMDLKDFAAAIPDGIFDFILFEACNMAGVEVVYELKEKADYIVASAVPVLSPGFEEIYSTSLGYLFEKEANLKAFAGDYYDLWNNRTDDGRSATITVFKTGAIDILAEVIKEINSSDVDLPGPDGLQTFDGRVDAPFYFFDFHEYYSSFSSSSQMQLLNSALANLILYTAHTPAYTTENGKFPINSYSGITTYILQTQLPELNQAYIGLKWYQAILP